MNLDLISVTLFCDEETLIKRWNLDDKCEWRTDDWLKVSLKSLKYFKTLENVIDTSNISIEEICDKIYNS